VPPLLKIRGGQRGGEGGGGGGGGGVTLSSLECFVNRL